MAAEGIPVSKQVLKKQGGYDSHIQVQRQSYFAVQLALASGSLGAFKIYGRCHPNAEWLPIFEDNADYITPGNCSLLRFYYSSEDKAPAETAPGESFAVGFDCNYFHDIRVATGTEGSECDIFLYGY